MLLGIVGLDLKLEESAVAVHSCWRGRQLREAKAKARAV